MYWTILKYYQRFTFMTINSSLAGKYSFIMVLCHQHNYMGLKRWLLINAYGVSFYLSQQEYVIQCSCPSDLAFVKYMY